jgi:hypothetical protein
MKKLLFIMLMLATATAIAQPSEKAPRKAKADKEIDKDATELAHKMCNCIDGIVKLYHPALQTMMKDMIEKGELEAQTKFAEALGAMSADEQQKVMVDIERMQKFEAEMAEKCGNELTEEYSKYDNDKEFEEKMMAYLKTLPECSFTYQIMLMGQKK